LEPSSPKINAGVLEFPGQFSDFRKGLCLRKKELNQYIFHPGTFMSAQKKGKAFQRQPLLLSLKFYYSDEQRRNPVASFPRLFWNH